MPRTPIKEAGHCYINSIKTLTFFTKYHQLITYQWFGTFYRNQFKCLFTPIELDIFIMTYGKIPNLKINT